MRGGSGSPAICPACKGRVPEHAWICPTCDFILDPSVLEQGGGGIANAATVSTAWEDSSEGAAAPEAMILGDVTVDPNDFQVLPGAGAAGDGRTATFLFYTSGATSRVLRPDVIPVRLEDAIKVPTTPYEDFILSSIDGRRTVRDIQRSSGLAPQEVTITLLTLLDKKIVRIDPDHRRSSAPPPPLAADDLPVARPRSSVKKPKKSGLDRTESRPIPARIEALQTAPEELPPIEPSALDAGDAEEVTEFAAIPLAPAPEPVVAPPRNISPEPEAPRARSKRGRKGSTSRAAAARGPSDATQGLEAVERTVSRGTAPVEPEAVRAAKRGPPPVPVQDSAPQVEAYDGVPTAEGSLEPRPRSPARRSLPPPLPKTRDSEPPLPKTRDSEPPPPKRSIARDETIPPKKPARASDAPAGLPPPLRAPVPDDDTAPPRRAVPLSPPLGAEDDDDTPPPRVPLPGAQDVRSDTPLLSRPPPDPAEAARPVEPPRPPPLLDPSFLVEVPPSRVGPGPAILPGPPPPGIDRPSVLPLVPAPPQPENEAAKEERRKALAAAVRRPVQERARKAEIPAAPTGPGLTVEPKSDAPPPAVKSEEKPPAVQVDGVRMAKAAKLFEQALKDKAEGNLVSARMNMKLATTFDPTNPLYASSYEELNKSTPAGTGNTTSRARQLYDDATAAERSGRIDDAVQLLERALEDAKEPAFYNRLGVLLAMKKGEFQRAQQLIETALEMSPGNTTYQHNLSKVLQMAAAKDVGGREAPKKDDKKGLLGMFGRKK